MWWTIARCIGMVEEADEIFNFNNTDDETNDTNYKSDNVNNS